jgi:hypothetical protein
MLLLYLYECQFLLAQRIENYAMLFMESIKRLFPQSMILISIVIFFLSTLLA